MSVDANSQWRAQHYHVNNSLNQLYELTFFFLCLLWFAPLHLSVAFDICLSILSSSPPFRTRSLVERRRLVTCNPTLPLSSMPDYRWDNWHWYSRLKNCNIIEQMAMFIGIILFKRWYVHHTTSFFCFFFLPNHIPYRQLIQKLNVTIDLVRWLYDP